MPDPDLEIREEEGGGGGGGNPDPEIRGLPDLQVLFSSLRTSVWLWVPGLVHPNFSEFLAWWQALLVSGTSAQYKFVPKNVYYKKRFWTY